MSRLPTPLFLLLVAPLCVHAELSRFRRVLDRYENRTYISENRDISLDITRLNNPGTHDVDPQLLDTTFCFEKSVGAAVAFTLKRMTGSELLEKQDIYDAAVGILYRTSGYSMRGFRRPGGDTVWCSSTDPDSCLILPYGQAISDSDTVITSLALSAGRHWVFTRYFAVPVRYPPFLNLDAGGEVEALYEDEENVEPLLPDSYIEHKYYQATRSAVAAGALTAKAGVGKPLNVTHVYKAFELEHELKRCGAISFTLSDETILALAELLAAYDSYSLRDHAIFKEFKARLDSMIVRDAAGEREKLRFLSQFAVRRLILRGDPELLRGPQVALAVPQSVTATLLRHEKHYAYDRNDWFNDTLRTDFDLWHDIALEAQLTWGIPVTPQWFVDLCCRKRLVSRQSGLEFYDKASVDVEKAIETSWTVRSTYRAGSRLLVQLGLDNILTHVALPKDWPYHSWLGGYFLIEDYIAIRARFSFYNSHLSNQSYLVDPPRYPRHGPVATVSITYGF